MVKVSVIIPTYNRASLLEKSIQSVLNQTFQDFEIIIVDDCSTDNTEQVVKIFQEKDNRIRYIKHEKNRGAAAARNTGIKAARGEFVAFQDSDDEWFSDKLLLQMQVFSNAQKDVGVVYTGFWRITNKKKIYIPHSWVKQKEGYILRELLIGNFIGTPTAIVRKECLIKMGMFDERLHSLEDWELWLRISKFYKFKCINKPLLVSYFTPNSVSTNKYAFIEAMNLILKKHFREFSSNKKILSKHYCVLGNFMCQYDDFKKGRSFLLKSLKLYPFRGKSFALFLLSLLGYSFYLNIARLKGKFNKESD